MNLKFCIIIFGVLQIIRADNANGSINGSNNNGANNNALVNSPYLELILCPIRSEFWECAKSQARRLLDTWNINLYDEWQKLKVDGDKELRQQLESRGFSQFENIKEKPSTILSKIEIGANYIRDFVKTAIKRITGDNENESKSLENQHEGRDLKDNIDTITKNDTNTRQMRKKMNHLSHVDLSHALHLLNAHGIKIPHKYGRSIGVERGKKKKKKILMKLMLIGTLIKGKIELLLKIFSAHLQVKFFLIALAGLVINLARFWLDIKKGVTPQKVIYYEHSHHQHHYDDHGGDWGGGEEGGGGGAGGGYWKRSLHSPTSSADYNTDPELYASGNSYNDDNLYGNRMAYSKQIPMI